MPTAGGAPSLPTGRDLTNEELIQRAKREISEIVREVTALARQAIERNVFFAALLDRTVCAIAANGAVIWDCRQADPIPVVRTGKITDASIGSFAVATHACLIREITSSRSPAVVPSTPDAIDPNLPSNPTDYPAAVVPILDLAGLDDDGKSGQPQFVLEVFLEHEAGLATQRGYLRFVTQMSDLASEFLRADEMRLSRRRETLQKQWMQSLERIHALASSSAVAAEIVDSAADMFACARVSLARMNSGRASLMAVSHVDSIDRRGQACRQLVKQIASLDFPDDVRLIDSSVIGEIDIAKNDHAATVDASLASDAAVRDPHDRIRMLLQVAEPKQPDAVANAALDQWSCQAFAILADRLRFESIPLAKVYLAIAPQSLSVSPTRVRRIATIIGGFVVLTMIAVIPTPMVVKMPATLRPDGTRTHYAPSDAVIESVEVKHGQTVANGDVLLRLRDWSLEEQMTTLLARRSVVSQRLQRSIALLVEVPASNPYPSNERSSTSDEELIQQQRLLEEEIIGLDEQIELFNAASDRLTIRADRSGIVDAWHTELSATGRPVRRGDAMIRVEPAEAIWMVDARVHQSRASIVLDRFRGESNLFVKVATLARPHQVFDAKFNRRSLAFDSGGVSNDGIAAGNRKLDEAASLGIELKIDLSNHTANGSLDDATWTYGAPATVMIDCGQRPLFQVVFYDLARAVSRTWARWI